MKSWMLFWVGLWMVVVPYAVKSQNVTVEFSHAQSGTLSVRQVWKSEVTDYSCFIWLTLKGSPTATALWNPEELVMEDGPGKIELHHITVPDAGGLIQDQKVGFKFSFSQVTAPGVYSGIQTVKIKTEKDSLAYSITLKLILENKSPVSWSQDTYTWETAKSTFGNWSVAWLPNKLGSNTLNLRVKNEMGQEEVEFVGQPHVELFRKFDNEPLTEGTLLWNDSLRTLQPGTMGAIPFDIDRGKPKPGIYEGEIRFKVKSKSNENPVSIVTKLTLTVKSRPFWAFLAILLGLLFGKVMKVIKDSETQINLLPQYDELKREARRLKKESQKWINPQLESLKREINAFKGSNTDAITKKIAGIGTAIDQLAKLEVLETLLKNLRRNEDTSLKSRFRTAFDGIRKAIQSGNFEEATKMMAALNPEFRLAQLNLLVDTIDYYLFAIISVNAEPPIQDGFKSRFLEDRKQVAIWDLATATLSTVSTRYEERSKSLLKKLVGLYRSVQDLLMGLENIPAEKEGELAKAGKQLLLDIVAADFSDNAYTQLDAQVRGWSEETYQVISGGREMGDRETQESLRSVEETGEAEFDGVGDEPSQAGVFGDSWTSFEDYEQTQLKGWQKIISLVTYVSPGPARLKYWASFILIFLGYVGLIITGMEIFYIEDPKALGAGGPLDFLPLFLWGLTVDVTNQTLAALTQKKSAGKAG